MKKSIILLLLCTLCSIINAQEFIDLGLSVNWCTVNIGASTSNETGNLYAWGEIEPKKHFSMENYKYKDPENDQWTVNIGNNISGTSYDVATQKNKDWRLPSQKEFLELCEKCTWEWTRQGNVNGYKVVGPNGNHIILPVGGLDSFGDSTENSGNYWSGTLSQGLGRTAISLTFDNEGYHTSVQRKFLNG